MKVNQYSVKYRDGNVIKHFEIEEFVKMINEYNTKFYPKAKMNIYKIRRYLLGKTNIPSPYLTISKVRLNEIIGIDKLVYVDYGKMFHKLNDFEFKTLK